MRIVQAVFGVFHHFELAHQLHRRGHLQRIYSTWPWARLKREGLSHELVRTFPLLNTAEYLLGRTGNAPPRLLSSIGYWNALSFDRWTGRKTQHEPCDALIAISGAGLLTGRRIQQRGGKFICDRGSTHQRFQEQTIADEYLRWKVNPPLPRPHIVVREEAIYEQADVITVPSNVARQSFLQMGVAADKVHVIPYGVRLDKFSPTASPPRDSFEVLFAGRISLRKGIPYLLEAFSRLRHPRKRLTLVGSMSTDVAALLRVLPVEGIVFIGSIPQAALAQRMSASHVLVLPSIEEGLALVQAQAMACGCPVVATLATGAQDLFSDGVEGFIVPDRDVVALTSRMQQLADDPDLRDRMGAAALARVRHVGGWDHYGDLWDDLLHKLTGIAKGIDCNRA